MAAICQKHVKSEQGRGFEAGSVL